MISPATICDDKMELTVTVGSPDGKCLYTEKQSGVVISKEDAVELGTEIGATLKAQVPAEL